MASRRLTQPPPSATTTDELNRGISGRVLTADTYRNIRIEVTQGDTDGDLGLHMCGILLGQITVAGTPEDELGKLRRVVDAVHASALGAP